MSTVFFSFQGELNYFLLPRQRDVGFAHFCQNHPSVKDTIESLGVPHTEVNCILVNDKSVDFSYLLQDGDHILVYPHSLPNASVIKLQPDLPKEIRFILDVHLGKLASLLRLFGFDTLYHNDYEDATIADISAAEKRIVLTRDRGLLMRKKVIYGYYIRQNKPKPQLVEVLNRFNLLGLICPFKRCIRCNGTIEIVDKALIFDDLPEQTRQCYNQFYQCAQCQQIYWQGSHYEKLCNFISTILVQTSMS